MIELSILLENRKEKVENSQKSYNFFLNILKFYKYLKIFQKFLNISEISKYLKKYPDICVKG